MNEEKTLSELTNIFGERYMGVCRAADFADYLTRLLTQSRFAEYSTDDFAEFPSQGVNKDLDTLQGYLESATIRLWEHLKRLESLIKEMPK